MFSNFFTCCDGKKTFRADDDEKEKEMKRKKELLKNLYEMKDVITIDKIEPVDPLDIILIDEKLIREDEKFFDKLKFTKSGIINYFNYYDNMEGFEKLYQKDNLNLNYKRSGSDFTDRIYLGKSEYKISREKLKSQFSIQELWDIVFLHITIKFIDVFT
jgi:hypothetical protein